MANKFCPTVQGATMTSDIDAVIKNYSDRLHQKRNAKNLKASSMIMWMN
jgi:hypothetical protein